MLYPCGTHREELTGLHATAYVLRQRHRQTVRGS